MLLSHWSRGIYESVSANIEPTKAAFSTQGDPQSQGAAPGPGPREVMRVKHYSTRTEHSYLGWIKRFILLQGKRHPRELGAPEVQAFISQLAVKHACAIDLCGGLFPGQPAAALQVSPHAW